MLRLTAVVSRTAADDSGAALGELDDFAVDPAAAPPPVVAVRVRARRQASSWACTGVRVVGGEIRVESAAPTAIGADRLLLRRHVLDSQVIDLAGKRLVRVGDVLLDECDGHLILAGVEVGLAPVLRRLGLARFSQRAPDEFLDWGQLHLASGPGHVLQLRGGRSAVHRLSQEELESLATALPPARARELRRHFELPRPRPAAPGELRRRRGRRFGSVLRHRASAPR
jgi:hypothetical protein